MLLLITAMLSALILEPELNSDTTDTHKYFIGSFIGFGMSAFEDDVTGDMSQGYYIPTGVQFLYKITSEIGIGAEFEFTGRMFTGSGEYYDDIHGEYFVKKYQIYMNTIGLIAEYFITDNIFLRGGIARYSGWGQYYDGYYDEWSNVDLESGIGFNFGAGYLMRFSETMYAGLDVLHNIVSMKPETADESYGFNHWAARISLPVNF